MRFTLIDRIVDLQPGARITAVKNVSLSEEYLADHFPRFPVLPGVFMLEAMTQASAWLIRASEDFAHSMVTLKETRNVKYTNFLSPGQTLTVTAEIKDQGPRETTVKVEGSAGGETKVNGRLILERYNLAETHANRAATDLLVTREMRKLFAILYPNSAVTNGLGD